MKRNFSLILCLVSGMTFAGVPSENPVIVPAPVSQPLGVTLGLGYDSSYMFRGREIDQNLITGSLDYKRALNDSLALRVGAWYGDSRAGGNISELDLSAGISANLGPAELGIGYRWYHIFDAPAGTTGGILKDDINEIGITLSTTVGPVDIGIGAYYDDRTRGFFYEFAVATEYKINDRISLVPGLTVGLNSSYYDVSGFSHVKPSLSLPIKLAKNVTLTPYVAGNIVFNDLKDAGEKSRVYGGVSLAIKF